MYLPTLWKVDIVLDMRNFNSQLLQEKCTGHNHVTLLFVFIVTVIILGEHTQDCAMIRMAYLH